MIRVSLHKFRCYDDFEIKFRCGELILLSGPSGSGKTTILEAIKWCLFGGMTHIYPTGSQGSSANPTSVTLKFPRWTVFESASKKSSGTSSGGSTPAEDEKGGYIVNRKKPTEQLVLECVSEGKTLTGDAAQNYIYSIFGSKTLWQSGAYINQGEHNIFMSLSNSDKTDMLQELAFTAQETLTPEWYLDKIVDQLKITEKEIIQLTSQYNAYNTMYESLMRENKAYVDFWKQNVSPEIANSSVEQITQKIYSLRNDLSIETNKVSDLRQKEFKARDVNVRREMLTKSLEKCTSQLKEVETNLLNEMKSNSLPDDINYLHTLLSVWSCQQEINQLKQQNLPIVPEEIMSQSQQELSRNVDLAYRLISEENNYQQICSNCGIKYNKEDIDTAITKLEDFIKRQSDINAKVFQYQEIMRRRKQILDSHSRCRQRYDQIYSQLQEPLEWFFRTFPDDLKTIDDIFSTEANSRKTMERISKELNEIRLRITTMQCPQCHVNLHMVNDHLTLSDHVHLSQTDAEIYRNKLSILSGSIPSFMTIKQQMKDADLEVKNIGDEPQSPGEAQPESDLNQYRGIISTLRTVKFPFPSTKFNNNNDARNFIKDVNASSIIFKHRDALAAAEGKMPKINLNGIDLASITPELIRRRIERLQSLRYQLQTLQQSQKQYECDLKMLPPNVDVTTIHTEIDSIEKKINTINSQIRSGDIVISLQNKMKELEKMRVSLVNATSDQESLLALKNLVIKVMHQALEDMVECINVNLNKITQELFGIDTIAELRLKKELKTKNMEKDIVNLRIVHKESTYDGISCLSGGEKDRLSLAFTIALAQITNPPFLFLDECTSSLNGSLRELCTKIIRKYLQGTTVIVICHETVEGDYDSTVEVPSYNN